MNTLQENKMSKIYVYENLAYVSTNYHTNGGLVIVTDREPKAAWAEYCLSDTKEGDYEYKDYVKMSKAPLGKPDLVLKVESTEEKVIVFPDSGCC